MLKYKFINIVFIILLILYGTNLNAQTFGFGCLGFFGGYGGVAYQSYKADGLNQFVKSFNEIRAATLSRPLGQYKDAVGYRVGINFFRASWESGFIITAKGYYQYLSKTNETSENFPDNTTGIYKYKLELKNWAVGIDLGYAFTNFLSWKIVDGAVHFNNLTLTNTNNLPGGTSVIKYDSEPGVLGYSIGTGIIISLVKDYVSLEGLAGYTYLKIDNLKKDDNGYFLEVPSDIDLESTEFGNFIESGGFTAVVQLNVGFPL